ncbi:MAG: amidase [Caldilineaceae bacterium]|nr:amidase [Caldilineaceae bacterium]MCB9157122.1 amidase [Caldilineaceae bacterium]
MSQSKSVLQPEPNTNTNKGEPGPITTDHIAAAEVIMGLPFTPAERELMLPGANQILTHYDELRAVDLPNQVAPALQFNPQIPAPLEELPINPPLSSPSLSISSLSIPLDEPPPMPEHIEQLAFAPIAHLAYFLRSGQITSQALTKMYLTRLKRYGPELECVVTITEELALELARRADAELAAGHDRGPLHGIPWGAKDLLATKGYPTTWGAMPYRDQVIEQDATVVRKLTDAGAVLVAKLTMGALAWGDVWFGGKTRSPWDLEQGSSGSSAGSGAATAAGLVAFAIGTETHGSIVSPSTNCGLSGLRPTFGRVSRTGAMALSWSMDKIGPMCRSVADCVHVFNAIYGPDGVDLTVTERPFVWEPELDLQKLRIGYTPKEFEAEYEGQANDLASLDVLRAMGVELIPIELPDYPLKAMNFILSVEAAAAFDELTRSNRDDLLVRQIADAWPNRFRQARLIPAVEYVQANRLRMLVMQQMAQLMANVDLYLSPALHGANLLLTNLTGHPSVVVPNGFRANGLPSTITFTGRLYEEATLLAAAQAYQAVTEHHLQHPPRFVTK